MVPLIPVIRKKLVKVARHAIMKLLLVRRRLNTGIEK